MKNQVQSFHSDEFGAVEVLMIGDKPYFPATECAEILGYSNTKAAILRHCKGVTKCDLLTNGGKQKKNYIPEGDLYRLIIRSKLPAAVRFEAFVFDEVLPSIRKYGAYATGDTLEEMLRNPQFAQGLLDALMEENAKNAKLEKKINALAPKASYCEHVLESGAALQVSVIAKDYGVSAAVFNKALHDLGVQYRVGNTWLLYQKHANKGYTKSRTYYAPDGECRAHTRWTQLGRQFLYETLAAVGILPEEPERDEFMDLD